MTKKSLNHRSQGHAAWKVLATSTKQQQLLTGSGPDMKPKVATYDRLLVPDLKVVLKWNV